MNRINMELLFACRKILLGDLYKTIAEQTSTPKIFYQWMHIYPMFLIQQHTVLVIKNIVAAVGIMMDYQRAIPLCHH